jgi:riboflavin biosynthesis pyrimidine reductase
MRVLQPSVEELGEDDLLELYATPASRHVRVNFLQALDGAIEVGGRSAALGGPSDVRLFGLLRSLADVVMVGAGTARSENYGPVRITPSLQTARQGRNQAPLPPIAVVTASADLDPSSRLFQPGPHPRPVIVTSAAADQGRCSALAEVADVLICGDLLVDLGLALDALAGLGHVRVLCEGGPILLNGLVKAQLLDDLCLTFSPVLAGPGHRTLSEGLPVAEPSSLRLGHALVGDGLLFTRYVVDRS